MIEITDQTGRVTSSHTEVAIDQFRKTFDNKIEDDFIDAEESFIYEERNWTIKLGWSEE